MTETQKPTFEVNSFYESVLSLRAKNPKTFAELSPATKASLLFYEQAKRQSQVDAETAV